MVRRVLLDSGGLKISQPGVDVLSAALTQLQFSSDWSAMGVVQQGGYSVSSYSGNRHAGSIPLIKTFASPPFCIFMLDFGAYHSVLGYGIGATLIQDRSDIFPATSRSCLVVQVGTTSIDVTAMYYLSSGGVPIPTYNLRYYVFDNNQ